MNYGSTLASRTCVTDLSGLPGHLPSSMSIDSPRIRLAIKALLALVVVGALVWFIEPERLWESLRSADPTFVVLALLLLPVNVALEALEWQLMIRATVPRCSWREAGGSLLCGYALGFFTPARLGELAGRSLYLSSGDRWELGTAVIVQRFVDMIAALACGLAALALFYPFPDALPDLAWQLLALGGAGALVTLSSALLFPHRWEGLLSRILPDRASQRIAFLSGLGREGLLRVFLPALMRYAVYVTQFVLLLHAMTPTLSWSGAYQGVALVYLAKFLIPPVTLMDLGIREGATVFFLAFFGAPDAAAFNASFLLFVMNLLLPAAAGLPFVWRMRLSRDPRNA